MHPGGVDILLHVGQFPGEVEMDGLVVVHGPATQFPEAEAEGHDQQGKEADFQPSDPALQEGLSMFSVGHGVL